MGFNIEIRPLALRVFESMAENNIAKLRAICYWNDDEGHLEDEITVWYNPTSVLAGASSTWSMDDIDGLHDLLWNIDDYGIFELDTITRTVTLVGEAWMPEPVLEKRIFDTPSHSVQVDTPSTFTPLVQYENKGPFDDPLANLWNQLSQLPVHKSGYQNAVTDEQFLNWPPGTKVREIVSWFQTAHPNRFSVKIYR